MGCFQSHIEHRARAQFMPFFAMLLGIPFILFCCAWLFAHRIKRQMFNLEPLDIARLVRQQDAVFESIYEGVISVDTRRRLTAINRAARDAGAWPTPASAGGPEPGPHRAGRSFPRAGGGLPRRYRRDLTVRRPAAGWAYT
ncbi:hypothetical protein [Chromobacterium phragmitis]|uniref:hypothetical protein n=1 Tax=Chromobacterium phragmitis TaxID=2202141 RepID=UPI0018E0AD1C|nr:hypothetical protein [Chromobacterium phragmitis]